MLNEAEIENALRSEVRKLFSVNDTDNVTVRRVRALTEQTLELRDGWFKNHTLWKDKSKKIIVDEAVRMATNCFDHSVADLNGCRIRNSKRKTRKRMKNHQAPNQPHLCKSRSAQFRRVSRTVENGRRRRLLHRLNRPCRHYHPQRVC